MKRTMARLLAVWAIGLSTTGLEAAEYALSVAADRADPVYKTGETITFAIRPTADGETGKHGTVAYSLSKDVGGPALGSGTLACEGEPLAVTAKLDEPGFVFCSASWTPDPNSPPIAASAAVAVDPLAIKPSLPVPDDFDAFWNGWKKKLSELPMEVKLAPMPVDPKLAVEAFDITINCLGAKPVRGYFARPRNAKPGSCPAAATYHAYDGIRDCSLGGVIGQAANGLIAIEVNPHGIETGQPQAYYDGLRNGELRGFAIRNSDDRDNFYFLWTYLRDLRALQYLTSLPEWDGAVLIVYGSSMGGGQAIAMGGLEPRVSLVLANVPALCDHSGFMAGRVCGWWRHVDQAAAPLREKVLQAMRYFDGVNFASRFRGEAVFSCGFLDGTCPPSSVYAALNAIPHSRKQMVYVPTMGHAHHPTIQNAFGAAQVRQVTAAHPPSTQPAER
ncbi:MAG: acetylxylan esterase [Phycisphaerae bacterium]|nr:acetylxylan esterase [Phycisphaerae bacterium]